MSEHEKDRCKDKDEFVQEYLYLEDYSLYIQPENKDKKDDEHQERNVFIFEA